MLADLRLRNSRGEEGRVVSMRLRVQLSYIAVQRRCWCSCHALGVRGIHGMGRARLSGFICGFIHSLRSADCLSWLTEWGAY